MVLLNLKRDEAQLLFQMVDDQPDFEDDKEGEEIYERLYAKLKRMKFHKKEE